MCGLVGLFGPPSPDRERVVARMLAAVAHRGPDGQGYVEEGLLALAHRRLSLLDLSEAAAQPMRHAPTGQLLAFNGTIYNYLELRDALREPPRSSGDTEVLLRLLAEQGEGVLARLNGTWALAHWDPQNRSLTLSRDRFGVKPLYWRVWGEQLAFASEIPPLLALDGGSRRAAAAGLASFLVDRRLDHSDETLFEGIHQVPPACSLRFEAEQPTRVAAATRHWSPLGAVTRRHRGDREELMALLDDAVRLRLRADVSVGFLLSGGLDSSAVVASAAHLAEGEAVAAYTLRYDDPRDESRYAEAVAAHCAGVGLHYVEPGEEGLEEALRRLVRVQGEPFADGSMLAHYRLMERVAGDGHKVVLGGQGGDEALAGYVPTFTKARAADLLLQGRPVAAREALGGGWGRLAGALPHLLPAAARNRLYRGRGERLYGDWLSLELVGQCAPRYPQERGTGRLASYLNAARSDWSLPGFLHYEDRNAMAFGLEARAPFLDYRLVEWGLSCPPEALIGAGLGKRVLRRGLGGRLPPEVSGRPVKQGLPAPAGRWLLANRLLVKDALALARERLAIAGADRAATAFDSAARGERALDPSLSDLLWRIVVAALWADEFDVSL